MAVCDAARPKAPTSQNQRGKVKIAAAAAISSTAATSHSKPIGREIGTRNCSSDARPKALAKPITLGFDKAGAASHEGIKHDRTIQRKVSEVQVPEPVGFLGF
jgi:hypothetical protein